MQIQLKKKKKEKASLRTAVRKAKLYCRIRNTGSTMSAQPNDPFCLASCSLPAGVKGLLECSGFPAMESFTIACEQKQYVTLKVGYFTKMCNYCIRKRDLMEDTVSIENAV